MKSTENASWLIIRNVSFVINNILSSSFEKSELSLPMYKEQRLEEVTSVSKCPACSTWFGFASLSKELVEPASPGMRSVCGLLQLENVAVRTSCLGLSHRSQIV